MSFRRPARRQRPKPGRTQKGSPARRARFESLEERRLLAVTASVTPEGVVFFSGDGQADSLKLSVVAGILNYTGAAPAATALNVSVNDITSLVIDLGAGGGDSLEFGGSAPIALPNSQLVMANIESTIISQSLSTAGDQEYLGNVTIGADAVLLSGGDITFAGNLDSAAVAPLSSGSGGTAAAFKTGAITGGDFLAWQRTGSTASASAALLAALAGSDAGSGFLTWQRSRGTSPATPFAGGDFTGDGRVDDGDLTAWRQGASPLSPTAALNAAAALTVIAIGEVRLEGAVGGAAPLASLNITAGQGIALGGGSLSAAGNSMTFNSPVTLIADTTIADAGNVTFNSTVDSDLVNNWQLTVNTPANTSFNGAVGGISALRALITDALGFTILNGLTVTTTEDQFYGDDVTLGNNATLSGDDVTFDKQVSGPFDLTVNTSTAAGVTRFNGAATLRNLRTNAPGTTVLGGLTVTTTQDQFYGDDVVLLQDTTLAGDDVTFDKKLNGTFDLTINTTTPTGVTRFNGAVGGDAPLRNLVTNALGTTVLGGPSIATTLDQNFGDAVVLASSATLSGNDVRFANTVNGTFNLTVNTAGNGETEFAAAVGGMPGAALVSLTTNPDGRTLLGGNVTTTQDQLYNDAVVLTSNATLSGNDVRFKSTLDGAFILAVDTTGGGETEFAGAVGGMPGLALVSVTTNLDGRTLLGANVTTTQDQTYNDAVVLIGDAVLAGNDIRFKSTVNGAFHLAVNTSGNGVTEFAAAVGVMPGAALASLTTNLDGQTQLGGDVTTTGDQSYGDDVTLLANAVLTGDDVTFDRTVSGPFDLTVNTSTAAGVTRFNGAATLRNLRTNAPGTTVLDGLTVTTTQDQFYGDDVVLLQDTTLAGDDVTFDKKLNG
ncbi:MAG: hypothetical protein IT424_08990, partial [Pirellulales bacterium]|nr:hypothetical protein [Pirellulales bacterium]